MKWFLGVVIFLIVANILDLFNSRIEKIEKKVKEFEAYLDSNFKDDLK